MISPVSFNVNNDYPDSKIFLELRDKRHNKINIEAVELASGEIVVRVSGETRVALASNISTITSDEYYRMEMNR